MASGKVLWACVLAGVAAVASGCGSGAKSTPANCDQVQPCGGDVVGTWKVDGACANAAQENIELQTTATCAGEVLDGAALNVSGSVTFNADLSYTISSWQKTAVLAETAPLSCLPASSCASVSAGAGATAQFTCVDASGGKCNCTLIYPDMFSADVGTYAISGETVNLTGAQSADSFPYCVEGPRLHLLTVSTTRVGPNGEAIVLSDIVAEKQ